MNRKELIKVIEKTVVNDFMVKEWRGNPEDFYCEVEKITYEYFEDMETCDVKVRFGKYVEDGDDNFNKEITFHDIQEDENEDFIRGYVIATLGAFEQHFNIFE